MQSSSSTRFSGKARDTLAKVLDHVLRDECSLSAVMREYRWNLTGPNIYSLNRLFDDQRRQLDTWLGKVIERTRAAGSAALGTIEELVKAPENLPATALPTGAMIGDLVARHEQMAHRLQEDLARLRDPITIELLTGLREFHETTAWMLRILHSGPGPEPVV